jgi:enamine deaminase RidA (YjgF/YER057c/UK114 family)
MTKITHTNPKEGYPVVGLSQVVTIETPAKILYLSGQVSKNQKGEVVGKGDLEAQTRQVYQNLAALLNASGASFGDVVKQNIYTSKPEEIQTFRRVRDEFFTGTEKLPASTYIGVTALADPVYLIEIEMIAVLP